MMPGLLDFLNTPESALGIGLLAAGSQGKSLGAGLLDATNYAASVRDRQRQNQWDMEDRALQEKYRNAQIADLERKSKADARQQALMAEFFGGGAGGSPTTAPAFGIADTGVMSAPQPSAPQSAGGRLAQIAKDYNLPIEALQADMLFNGGKKIAELVSTASKPNWQNVNGNLVNTNAPGFTGGFQPGMSISANGQATAWQPDGKGGLVVGAPAGALDTYRAYQGIQSDAKPIKVYNPATGRDEYMSEGAVLRQPSRTSMPPAQPGVRGPGYNGGDRDSANAETLRYIDAELQKPGQSQDTIASLLREKQRLQAQSGLPQSGNYAAGPSAQEVAQAEADRTRLVDTAKADVVRDTAQKAAAKRGTELMSGIDRAIELLESNPTSSLAGSAVDKTLGAFGISTQGAETSARLSALSGWLVSNVPRMEGPQSNVDVDNYRTMAGRVGDSALPIGVRISAAKEVRALQLKYAELNGMSGNGGATGSRGEPEPKKEKSVPKVPMKGQIVKGYRYKGGDPSLQESWEPK